MVWWGPRGLSNGESWTSRVRKFLTAALTGVAYSARNHSAGLPGQGWATATLLNSHSIYIMTLPQTGDLIRPPAERLAHEQAERAEARRQELAELRSGLNSPEVRIRAWEKIHQLRLPSDPEHPVLDVIAISTRLTLAQVQEEQRTRAARAANKKG